MERKFRHWWYQDTLCIGMNYQGEIFFLKCVTDFYYFSEYLGASLFFGLASLSLLTKEDIGVGDKSFIHSYFFSSFILIFLHFYSFLLTIHHTTKTLTYCMVLPLWCSWQKHGINKVELTLRGHEIKRSFLCCSTQYFVNFCAKQLITIRQLLRLS